jgi:hypothetical protein
MHLKERKKEKHDEKCIIRSFIVFLPRCFYRNQIKEEKDGTCSMLGKMRCVRVFGWRTRKEKTT